MEAIVNHSYKASDTPLEDIGKISYDGQNPDYRRYKSGYEKYMNSLPVLSDDESLEVGMLKTNAVMGYLSQAVRDDKELIDLPVNDGEFKRTILAIEPPTITQELKDGVWVDVVDKENAELVVAHWGKGFSSPIHGHATGFLFEEVLSGRVRVNNYRIVDLENKIVRPHIVEIVSKGVFVSDFTPHNPENMYDRQTLVHNFTAIERANTLHFLPEHTRDGRDNQFTLEQWQGLDDVDVTQIDSRQAHYSQPGDVILVRSTNVPEYGDHFIVVTGPPIKKPHGYRVQDVAVMASENDTRVLNGFKMKTGLILLKLNDEAKREFLDFHGIVVEGREVKFPKF